MLQLQRPFERIVSSLAVIHVELFSDASCDVFRIKVLDAVGVGAESERCDAT